VLVDVREDDWQLDVVQLEAAHSSRTRAVVASHLHGGIVDMPSLREWADRRNVVVVEDACQVHGATVHGRPAGMWGDAGVWSFGGSKLVSAGRGGAVFTNRRDIVQRIRLYTQRGNDAYPLSELQAAVILPQLRRLPERHQTRLRSVELLRGHLSDTPGLRLFAGASGESSPAYYKVGMQYDADRFDGLSRDRFAEALRAEGVAVDPGFRALHQIHARSRFRTPNNLKTAEQADSDALVLHHPVLLEGLEAIAQAAAAISRVAAHAEQLR
jgi:dTDP-4-amino-4,6-dideoxygalactose transaminase